MKTKEEEGEMETNKSKEMFMASPFEAIPHFDLTYVKRMSLTEYEKEIEDEERDLLANDNTNEHNTSQNVEKINLPTNKATNLIKRYDRERNQNDVKRGNTQSEVKQYELRRQALSSRNSAITFSSKYPSYDWLGRELCVLYQIQDHAVVEELGRVAVNHETNCYDGALNNNCIDENNSSRERNAKKKNKSASRRSGVRLSSEVVFLNSDQRTDTNVREDDNCKEENCNNSNRPIRQMWEPYHSTSLSTKRSMSSVRSTKSRLEFANNNSEFIIYRDSCANVVTTTTAAAAASMPHSTLLVNAPHAHFSTDNRRLKVKKISLPPPIIERNTSESNTLTQSRQRARSLPLSTSEKENSDTYPPPSSLSKKMRIEIHVPTNSTDQTTNTNTCADNVYHTQIDKNSNNNNIIFANVCDKDVLQKVKNKEEVSQEQQERELNKVTKQESNNVQYRMSRPSHAYIREIHDRLTDVNDPIRLTAFRESDVRATKQLFRNTGTTMLLGQSHHSTIHSAANYVQPIASSLYGMRAASVSAHKVLPAMEDNYSNYFVHDNLHVMLPTEPLPLLKCHSVVRLHNRTYKLTRFYVSSEVYEALDITQETNEEQYTTENDEQEITKVENNIAINSFDDNEGTEKKTRSCNRVLLYRWRRTNNNNSNAVHKSHPILENNLHEGWRASIGLSLCSHDMARVRSYCFATGGITVIDVPSWYVYYPLSSLPFNGPSYCTTLKMMLKVLSTMIARRVVHGSLNSLSDIFIALPSRSSSSLQQQNKTPHKESSTQKESKRVHYDHNTNMENNVLPTSSNVVTEGVVKVEKHDNLQLPSEANNHSVEVELEPLATRKEKLKQQQEQESNTEKANTKLANHVALLPVIIPVHWERMVDFGMFIDRNVGRNIAYDSEDESEQSLLTLGYDLATTIKSFLTHPTAMELTSEQHAALQKLIMMTSEATQVANYLVQIQCVMRTLPTNLNALQQIIHIVEESTST